MILPVRNSFHFTDYSPRRFQHIRNLSHIDHDDYIDSFNSTTMPSFSEGKSGAFVYFSSNGKYIVKTTTPREFEVLLHMLPHYEEYLHKEQKRGRESLITRYLGAHRIVMYDIPLYFVVMHNVCPIIDEKYDLKGSWVNRHGSKKNKDPAKVRPKKYYTTATGSFRHSRDDHNNEEKETVPLFLDNDVKSSFLLHQKDAMKIASQIQRDSKFLEGNTMDYCFILSATFILQYTLYSIYYILYTIYEFNRFQSHGL
jgi:1-phosphatidylinositol-4-phosphate 5-kinase